MGKTQPRVARKQPTGKKTSSIKEIARIAAATLTTTTPSQQTRVNRHVEVSIPQQTNAQHHTLSQNQGQVNVTSGQSTCYQQQPRISSSVNQQQTNQTTQAQTTRPQQQQQNLITQTIPSYYAAGIQIAIPRNHNKTCGSCLIEYTELIKPQFTPGFVQSIHFHRFANYMLSKAESVILNCEERTGFQDGDILNDMLSFFDNNHHGGPNRQSGAHGANTAPCPPQP